MSSDGATSVASPRMEPSSGVMHYEAKTTSAGNARISAIDGLRATAMLMVFAYHVHQFSDTPDIITFAGTSLGNLIGHFHAGVDLFMVISGFCLFWPIVHKRDGLARFSTRDYAIRRIRRIVPPYYMAIALMLLLPNALVVLYHVLGKEAKWQSVPDLFQIVTHLTFTHTLFPSTWAGIQGVFWSLGLEAQFYLVFPLVVWAYRRAGMWVVVAMTLLSIVYRLIAWRATIDQPFDVQMIASITFLGRWMQFAAGMTAAWLVARTAAGKGTFTLGAGVAMVVVSALLYVYGTHGTLPNMGLNPSRDIVLALAFALLIVAVCGSTVPVRYVFENRIAVGLGFFSYSVFLVHQNIAYYMTEFLKKVGGLEGRGSVVFVFMMTAGLLAILAFSYIFFRLFEKPFMSKAPKRARAPAADAAHIDRPVNSPQPKKANLEYATHQ